MPYTKTAWKDHVVDGGTVIQQGTPVSAGNLNKLEAGVEAAHQQLEGAARQTQSVRHGVQILNGDVNSPVSLQLEGRTLVPMQNTVLDPLKHYVQADKKVRLNWADNSNTQGVAKFTAKAERPGLSRTENFDGKVSGSLLENPHIQKWTRGATLSAPTAYDYESTQVYLDLIKSIDGQVFAAQSTNTGQMAQQGFSYDLIALVERNMGRIPRATTAEKAQWLRDNGGALTYRWWGLGSNAAGNKATLKYWKPITAAWAGDGFTHTNATVTALAMSHGAAGVPNLIDNNGFVHCVAYAEPSDGVAASNIRTDYAEIFFTLKPEAILHDPRVPLYEVEKAVYDELLVTIPEADVVNRYPSVEGVTHLQNPYVMAEGANLVPPFNEWATTQRMSMPGPYDAIMHATGSNNEVKVVMPAMPNTNYHFSSLEGRYHIYLLDAAKALITPYYDRQSLGITTTANTGAIMLIGTNTGFGTAGDYAFKQPMLTLGTAAKTFVPRNQSYVFFETKLVKIGTITDSLYEQDGKYVKRKAINEMPVDGLLTWGYGNDYPGFKRFATSVPIAGVSNSQVTVKPTGALIKNAQSWNSGDLTNLVNTALEISVSDLDTGFNDAYIPTNNEIKAYFNGWKVKTADGTTNKPTAWTSVVDGSDAPTQTEVYVAANKAPNYTPYKIFYSLAAPAVEEVKTEGAVSVNGQTQVEVGSGLILREKVTPVYDAGYKVHRMGTASSPFKHPFKGFLKLYKNGQETPALRSNFDSVGQPDKGAFIEDINFDPTAEYTVTYQIYDRQKFTTNAVNVLATFANNIRAALEDTQKKVEDTATGVLIQANIMYDVLKRLKAGGL